MIFRDARPILGSGDLVLSEAKTLYARRGLINTADVIAWAKAQGFPTTQDGKALHITQAYSKEPLEWPKARTGHIIVPEGGVRSVGRLGDDGAVVLHFESDELTDGWQLLKDAGAVWKYDGYKPHLTISWQVPADFSISSVQPYSGRLEFGPQIFAEIEENWQATAVEKISVLKVDDTLGLVFGWGMICKVNGEDHYDQQADHIPEDVMLHATSKFMEGDRVAKAMHKGGRIGQIIHSFPLTTEIMKAYGLSQEDGLTGWIHALKPSKPEYVAKFATGEWTGFSIGGEGGWEETA